MISTVTIPSIENNRVVFKKYEYCAACKSINVKTSQKGNKYCGEICWEDLKYKKANADVRYEMAYEKREDECNGEVGVEY